MSTFAHFQVTVTLKSSTETYNRLVCRSKDFILDGKSNGWNKNMFKNPKTTKSANQKSIPKATKYHVFAIHNITEPKKKRNLCVVGQTKFVSKVQESKSASIYEDRRIS